MYRDRGALMRAIGGDLIVSINQAKNLGRYDVANFLWAVGLVLSGELGLSVSIETDDPRGICFSDTYYDLVVLVQGDKEANIPAPLLTAQAASEYPLWAAAHGNFVPRKVHSRRAAESPSAADFNKLYAEAAAVLRRLLNSLFMRAGTFERYVREVLVNGDDVVAYYAALLLPYAA